MGVITICDLCNIVVFNVVVLTKTACSRGDLHGNGVTTLPGLILVRSWMTLTSESLDRNPQCPPSPLLLDTPFLTYF